MTENLKAAAILGFSAVAKAVGQARLSLDLTDESVKSAKSLEVGKLLQICGGGERNLQLIGAKARES